MNKRILRFKNKKGKKVGSIQILTFVGLAGSGKSTAANYLKEKKYPHVYFGGVILDEMKNRGIEINAENEKLMRHKLREELGGDVVVKKIIEQIEGLAEAGQKRIVADGLYTWEEYKVLKRRFPGVVTVIALVPPKSLRHKRIANRKDRSFTGGEIIDRDYNEIEQLNKGNPIAMADYFIINNHSEADTRRKIDKLLREIEF